MALLLLLLLLNFAGFDVIVFNAICWLNEIIVDGMLAQEFAESVI